MIHNLSTLLERERKRHPELVSRLKLLDAYTEMADNKAYSPKAKYLNYGFRSLKWLIYSLRSKMERKELQVLYHSLICETIARDTEDVLYANVFDLDCGLFYARNIEKPDFSIEDWPIVDINGYRVLLNTTTQNITNLVFRDDYADIILLRTPEKHAAFILSRKVINKVDLRLIYNVLPNHEPWQLSGNNLLICGGRKRPKETTNITIDQLISLAEEHL